MILLFGNKAKAGRGAKTHKNNGINKPNPVENAGILAMSISQAKSLLTMGEFDTFISSHPMAIDYSMYSSFDFSSEDGDGGFLGGFSAAVAMLGGDGGFAFGGGGFDCGGGASFSGAGSCSSFSSVG